MIEELSLIKSLLTKSFYDDYKGTKCPPRLFRTTELGRIKTTIDEAMQEYKRDLSVEEVAGLFFVNDPAMTTAERDSYEKLFTQIKSQPAIGSDVANGILAKLFQKYLGREIANVGVQYVNGGANSLEPLRRIIENYRDDFLPDLNIEWDDLSLEGLLEKSDLEARWRFNLSSLAERVEGVNAGHLIIGGARPNTGKTSFHASLLAGPDGFAVQGANCIVLCNEEAPHRVGSRYLTAASGMTMREIKNNPREALSRWNKLRKNIRLKDATGQNMHWVELICKTYSPDILVLDMGDKFAPDQSHEGLKLCAIHARQIAKEYNCAVFYMSQLSAEAEGRANLNQSMMEGSKTGKASEAALMLLIAKDTRAEGLEANEFLRHVNVAKNKLSGWHGRIDCILDYTISRYDV